MRLATMTRSTLTAALALAFTLTAAAQTKAPAVKFSGAQTMLYTKQIVAFGPRYNGSDAKTKVEAYLKNYFAPESAKGWVDVDSFVSSTPAGPQIMRNYVVKFPGTKPGVILLASHYETNYPLRNIPFVGANDGACTSAILMEMANEFRHELVGGKLPGYSVWLVFFDGEEAVREWTHTDSLYGSRHMAAKMESNGTLGSIKALLLADMIGDRSLNILRDQNSTPWVEDLVYQAAVLTGHEKYFFKTKEYVEDDHLPFAQRGVPVADIIDMDYGPHDATHPDGWHHTAEDTVDKLSVASLQISGDVITESIHLLNQK